MKGMYVIAILFILMLVSHSAYSQLWKQYADSATFFIHEKNLNKAIELYIKAKEELTNDSLETSSYANTCDNLANLYTTIDQHEHAEPLYITAKQTREKLFGKMSSDYALSCYNLGSLYSKKGVYDKAEPLLTEARQLREMTSGKQSLAYAESCCELGVLYTNMRQYQKAEPLLLEAEQIREKIAGTENVDYASSCNSLGRLYRLMGYYEKAEPLLLKAKQIREKAFGKNNADYAQSCHRLAILYQEMGQYKKAESLLLEAKQIRETALGKKSDAYASSCNRLALLYQDMGEFPKAEPLLKESKQMRAEIYGRQNLVYALSCNHLGDLYVNLGEYQKAKLLFLEAKQIYEKNKEEANPDYAENCNSLGILYMMVNQYQKAEPLLLKAKQIRAQVLGKEHQLYTKTCIDLADLYRNMNEPEKAKAFYVDAFNSQNIQLKKVFQFTSEAEKQAYVKKMANFQNHLFSFYSSANGRSSHGFSYNVSLSNRNLILSSTQQLRQAIYNTSDTLIKDKYNAWIEEREQLAYWYSRPIANRPEYLKDLEAQANTLEKELALLSATFKKEQAVKEVTWKNIQQYLQGDEAAIEFVKFDNYDGKQRTDSTYYVALLLRKDKPQPELIPLFESRQLNNLLRVSNTSLSINALYSSDKGVNTAYNLLWKPIEQHLHGIRKIYFCPAGLLFRVSFAALPVNDQQVLSDKYELVQLNSTAAVVTPSVEDEFENAINTADKIYLFGAIQYDVDSGTLKKAIVASPGNKEDNAPVSNDLARGDSLQFLAGTEKEIKEIDSLENKKGIQPQL